MSINFSQIASATLGTVIGTGVVLAAGVYGLQKLDDHLAKRSHDAFKKDFDEVQKQLNQAANTAFANASKK